MQANLYNFHRWLLQKYGKDYNALFGIGGSKNFEHDRTIERRLILLYDEYLAHKGFQNIQHTKNLK